MVVVSSTKMVYSTRKKTRLCLSKKWKKWQEDLLLLKKTTIRRRRDNKHTVMEEHGTPSNILYKKQFIITHL